MKSVVLWCDLAEDTMEVVDKGEDCVFTSSSSFPHATEYDGDKYYFRKTVLFYDFLRLFLINSSILESSSFSEGSPTVKKLDNAFLKHF